MDINLSCMSIAFEEALKAVKKGEVPVGAAIFYENSLIAADHNRVIELKDPTAHAEMLVLKQAATMLHNYRLQQTKLYVTLEPCPMCISAAIHARVEGVYFGTICAKWGYMSRYNMDLSLANHRVKVICGIMEQETSELLKKFFGERR